MEFKQIMTLFLQIKYIKIDTFKLTSFISLTNVDIPKYYKTSSYHSENL